MTYTDPIGDMFSRIRNGQMRASKLNSNSIIQFQKKYLKF